MKCSFQIFYKNPRKNLKYGKQKSETENRNDRTRANTNHPYKCQQEAARKAISSPNFTDWQSNIKPIVRQSIRAMLRQEAENPIRKCDIQ